MIYLYVTGLDAEEYSTGHARTWTLTLTVGHGSATYVCCDETLKTTIINCKYKVKKHASNIQQDRTGEGLMEAEKRARSKAVETRQMDDEDELD